MIISSSGGGGGGGGRRGAYSCKESCHDGHCLPPPHSAKCLCLYLFLSLTLFVVVASVLITVFATRLKKPTFNLQSIQMDRSFSIRSSSSNYSGDGNETSSCSVASLLFAAQNPNGIGIRYSAVDLGVAYANESVGAMDVPTFYQPPRSSNVTVLMHALFEESNVSRLVVSELSAQRMRVEIRIAGSIDATTHFMNFQLPKLQFTLDCTIATNYTDLVLREGIDSVTTRKALQVSTMPPISQKCSIKLHMRSRAKRTRLTDLGC
ncbi:uncharacterized protein LOC100825869 [Brachypodium distachyon]|uniref:Late embryogenesis abundant protein LEA-2 subgroup domain-containing protein n=1 Tax=Brachypodium distachyon TaxID=15368 RepID=I1IQD1_BRADI|nr:uncharacterized protein LOC100825869 [Brachypodium distachyon]KQJ90359.1 hypothetical protein BRADI_4g31050v3 [Brachypodium distachyon]|eukprot:XP_003578163.2 uncharacterized protein LOC100825869 [Brachypodium distachyon]